MRKLVIQDSRWILFAWAMVGCSLVALQTRDTAIGGERYTPSGVQLQVPPEPPDQSPASGDVLTFDAPELAGISGLREMWDRPVVLAADGKTKLVGHGRFGDAESAVWNEDGPGAIAFDAVHRSLLVRFPGCADRIAEKVRSGARIVKAELVLPFKQTELWPLGYQMPAGMSFLGDKWAKSTPRWHAIAWTLRRPWKADSEIGPTYNQHIKGRRYWTACGARNQWQDRHFHTFGPAEVSAEYPRGRLDVTLALTHNAFGPSTGERLRAFEDHGMLVRKWEFYDAALWRGGYEWVTARGAQGIVIDTPRLEVTFQKCTPQTVSLPKPVDVTSLAASNEHQDAAATIPTEAEFARLKEKFGFQKPDWMPDWQWAHVRELKNLGGGKGFPETYEDYLRWIDEINGNLPRRWAGFDASARAQEYLLYGDCWPASARENMKLYWWAWLMPDRKITDLVQGYIGGGQAQEYYARTRDWRGNFSVYRTYCHAMGTMNFNHWAAAGTLFGGTIIENDFCIAEGRHGLEQWPLRTWCWFDGSTQESIDHYYFAHSLAAQKAFADFGPTHLDRMMGQSILAKSVEELTSAFHPNLRRFISSSGRTGVGYTLAIQDGLSHILHTISRRGALTDADKEKVTGGMPTIGRDFRPGQVALQTVTGPWAPPWASAMLDDKPLPYEMVTAYKKWGGYAETPLYRKTYLGENYGLASLDVSVGNETVPVMAQWRRDGAQVESHDQISTLLIRPGLNRTELIDSLWHGTDRRNPNGVVGTQGSHLCSVQHKNKIVCLASPFKDLHYSGGRPAPTEVTSIQTTIGLFNYQPTPTWKLYVDGAPVTSFPHTLSMKSRITIEDGATFVGLIPVPATNLGRDADIVISRDGMMTEVQGGGETSEALRINAYLYRSDMPLSIVGSEKLDLAYGGFAIELGERDEYGDFARFQEHIRDVKLTTKWNEDSSTLDVVFVSGDDTLEFGYKPGYTGGWDKHVKTSEVFPYRRVNGVWPYLAPEMDRDTTLTQQGRSGRLAKNGAVFETEADRMAYLQTEPKSGTYAAFNPFPEPMTMKLTTPDGVRIEADGKLGIARIAVSKKDGFLAIDHAVGPKYAGHDDVATQINVFGLDRAFAITLNGKRVPDLGALEIDGERGFAVPLTTFDQPATASRRPFVDSMMADSPVTFPERGALPAKFRPDRPSKDRELPEEGYYIFGTPERSLEQIAAIQKEMPAGDFTPPPSDWTDLSRTRRILTEGGKLRILAMGDSIVNDTMRSGWVARLQEEYPKADIEATVYVRGGGGCQHYKEENRIARFVVPRQPDLVLIGGISQRDVAGIGTVIEQLRAELPDVEILLFTGTFGRADPREHVELAQARHSGTAPYGIDLYLLARDQRCAYLDMTTPWSEYVRSSELHPHRFYRDVVHANEYGEQILSKIMMAFWTAK